MFCLKGCHMYMFCLKGGHIYDLFEGRSDICFV